MDWALQHDKPRWKEHLRVGTVSDMMEVVMCLPVGAEILLEILYVLYPGSFLVIFHFVSGQIPFWWLDLPSETIGYRDTYIWLFFGAS